MDASGIELFVARELDLDDLLVRLSPLTEDKLIPLLQAVQDACGYLPAATLMQISRRTGIPASRMYGVATFYEQFHLAPRGRHTIKCCRGTACHVRNGAAIADELRRVLKVEDGGTTDDLRYTFETVACLGTCFLAPVMMIDSDYYGGLTPRKLGSALERYE